MSASSVWSLPWHRHGWSLVVALFLSFPVSDGIGAAADNPIAKTIELLTRLQAAVVKNGEKEQAVYTKYYEWCTQSCKDKEQEIHAAKRQKVKLEAELEVATNDVSEAGSKIEELGMLRFSIAQKLKHASEVRESEKEAFEESASKLEEAIELLDKAIKVLQKQTGARVSFVQSKSRTRQLRGVLLGLGAVIEAAGLPPQDKLELTSLLQGGGLGVPDGKSSVKPEKPDEEKAYVTRSGGVIKAMEDMRNGAEVHLRECRDAEAKAKHNYDQLKQQLDDEASEASKQMQYQKGCKAQRLHDKADLEGDLAHCTRQFEELTAAYKNTQEMCMARAADHEQSLRSRAAELKALTEAKSTIQASMGGAESRTYSLLQTESSLGTSTTIAHFIGGQMVGMLKRLAEQEQAPDLVQLTSRVSALARYGAASGEDPFSKVKALMKDAIARLEQEQGEHREFCKDMNKTEERVAELEDVEEGMQSRADQAVAASIGLKAQVKELQHELADLAQRQLELDRVRQSEHKVYLEAKGDLQTGLAGTRMAMRLLRDFYSADEERADTALLQAHEGVVGEEAQQQPSLEVHEKSTSVGAGIIGLLEVVESDVAKTLAQVESNEDVQQADYEKETQEAKVIKALKEKDVDYKTRKYKGIDKDIADLSSDHDDALDELVAVREYYQKVKEQCMQGDSYPDRQAHRKAKIRGLEEALAILEGQEALLQHRPGLRRPLSAARE